MDMEQRIGAMKIFVTSDETKIRGFKLAFTWNNIKDTKVSLGALQDTIRYHGTLG
jgi:hypothetical protein